MATNLHTLHAFTDGMPVDTLQLSTPILNLVILVIKIALSSDICEILIHKLLTGVLNKLNISTKYSHQRKNRQMLNFGVHLFNYTSNVILKFFYSDSKDFGLYVMPYLLYSINKASFTGISRFISQTYLTHLSSFLAHLFQPESPSTHAR